MMLSGVEGAKIPHPTPHAPHPTPYTPHPTPYTPSSRTTQK
ncbi:hypothetical protein [Chroococcidiopsis cubana]|nr:hypothetical protein [Chroococcidiopsis cubana]